MRPNNPSQLTRWSLHCRLTQDYLNHWWSWGEDAFANDLAGAINRVNYNQRNEQMNALAGLVAYLPASGGGQNATWAIEGGNSRLAVALIKAAGGVTAKYNHKVSRVSRNASSGLFSVSFKTGPGRGDEVEEGPFDAVILAAPLELSNIVFSLDDVVDHAEATSAAAPDTDDEREFQTTIATYVTGTLQPSYFGVSELPSQTVLFSNDASTPVSAISLKATLDPTPESGGKPVSLFKVFSEAVLDGPLLSSIFGKGFNVLRKKSWLAYPKFSPPEKFTPFHLAPGLCNVNTIENAASAMEMSAIGAKNCALLVSQHIGDFPA